jgi:asparagine synthase (glutamine-hydrolysing)
MCGIAGTVRFDGAATVDDRQLVASMSALQANRGPDGEGIHALGSVVLGHRRLSIIDLTEAASQPMPNENGDLWVIFNGEIYNYRELRYDLRNAGHCFATTSDTEVLIHGYEQWGGEGLVKRLRGMFAFAIHDARTPANGGDAPVFFAARDRLGIKPLYYARRGARFAFASEVKSLAQSGATELVTDASALSAFLSLGSVPGPRTWLRGVECLPPGHSLAITAGRVEIRKYWDISYRGEGASGREMQIPAILNDSVERHLLADVPVGVFLSGGVDSAGVAYLASRGRNAPLRTLTVVFDEEEFTEASEARELARAFGTDHHEIRVTAEDFKRELPAFLDAVDQPTADGVNTYFVSMAARKLGLKVVLSGVGGDEVFFGYRHYRALIEGSGLLGSYARCPSPIRRMLGLGASAFAGMGGAEKWQRFDYCAGRPLDESLYLLVRGFFPPARVRRLLGTTESSVGDSVDQSFEAIRVFGENGVSRSSRFHYIEMKRYLHDQLLRDSDVFSMAHSIELRVPLLDHLLVEAGCGLAPASRIRPGINKPSLVDAIDHPSIRAAAVRPKRGFILPFARWMAAHADEMEERALLGGLLDPAEVRDCWKDFRSGRLHWSGAWSTVVLASLSSRIAAVA